MPHTHTHMHTGAATDTCTYVQMYPSDTCAARASLICHTKRCIKQIEVRVRSMDISLSQQPVHNIFAQTYTNTEPAGEGDKERERERDTLRRTHRHTHSDSNMQLTSHLWHIILHKIFLKLFLTLRKFKNNANMLKNVNNRLKKYIWILNKRI